MKSNMLYLQYSNCVAVRGFLRSALYDLQTNRFKFITNELQSILSKSVTVEYHSSRHIHTEDINVLIKEKYGQLIDIKMECLFIKMDLSWRSASQITNCILICNGDFSFPETLFTQVNELLCKDIQVNGLNCSTIDEIDSLLKSTIDFNSIQLLINYFGDENYMENLFEKYAILDSLFVFKSPFEKIDINKEHKIFYTKKTHSYFDVQKINKDYFTSNRPFYTESQLHNTYFNRKLCIDYNGYIRNSPELEWHYGHISEVKLEDAIKDKGTDKFFFKKYAEYKKAYTDGTKFNLNFDQCKPAFDALFLIHKELIDVCKACEFRHMCVDACIPLQRNDGTWYRSKECNYNPYICKWEGEEGYQSLDECGVICDETGFSIDEEKIAKINEALWTE